MSVNVETLEKLERRITLTLPADTITSEVNTRLKRLARTVKADGFRPGKVPMSVVQQRYGYSVHYEVMNDKVSQAFSDAASAANLRVAGAPRITEKEDAPEGAVAFDATFEVYPEIKFGDLTQVEIERVSTEVTDEAIDKTLEILRKQRRSFAQRPQTEPAAEGDRVTIDFEGKIDGVPFEGGKAEGFQFLIGEGQMLEAVRQGRSRHEGRRVEDLSAAVPGGLPGQGRGRQGGRLHGHPEQGRGPAPARGQRGPRQVARHCRRHGRGAARRHPQEPRARGQVPRARAQQGCGDGRPAQGGRTRRARMRWCSRKPTG